MTSSSLTGAQDLPQLFASAFTHSRNAMVLVDDRRRLVDVNGAYIKLLGYERRAVIGRPIYRYVVGGPLLSPSAWKSALKAGQFSGEAELLCADGRHASVQWAATSEFVTGRRLTLVVALSTSRWGSRFRRPVGTEGETGTLSAREREVVSLVALGHTGPEIADQLQIAHHTVRTHVRNAMTKTDARSRAHLVAKSLGEGLMFLELRPSAARRPSTGSPAVPEIEQSAGTQVLLDHRLDLPAMGGEPER